MEDEFKDRLGQPVVFGDLIYRSYYNSLERVINTGFYVKKDESVHCKINAVGYRMLHDSPIYRSNTWYRRSTDITKVNISPEVANILIMLDYNYAYFHVDKDTGNLELNPDGIMRTE